MLSFPEDVFLLRTKDGKSPEIYALFSTVRWVVQLQPLRTSSHSCPSPALSLSPRVAGCSPCLLGVVGVPTASSAKHGSAGLTLCPIAATFSRALLSVCTAWPTSGRSSMGPLPTERAPITGGVPMRAGCPTHGRVW